MAALPRFVRRAAARRSAPNAGAGATRTSTFRVEVDVGAVYERLQQQRQRYAPALENTKSIRISPD